MRTGQIVACVCHIAVIILRKELLTTFSGIPTSIGGLFLTADATLASPETSESSPGRQLHAPRHDPAPACARPYRNSSCLLCLGHKKEKAKLAM